MVARFVIYGWILTKYGSYDTYRHSILAYQKLGQKVKGQGHRGQICVFPKMPISWPEWAKFPQFMTIWSIFDHIHPFSKN